MTQDLTWSHFPRPQTFPIVTPSSVSSPKYPVLPAIEEESSTEDILRRVYTEPVSAIPFVPLTREEKEALKSRSKVTGKLVAQLKDHRDAGPETAPRIDLYLSTNDLSSSHLSVRSLPDNLKFQTDCELLPPVSKDVSVQCDLAPPSTPYYSCMTLLSANSSSYSEEYSYLEGFDLDNLSDSYFGDSEWSLTCQFQSGL